VRSFVTVRFERRLELAENRSRETRQRDTFSIRFLDMLESYSNQTAMTLIKCSLR